MSDIKTYPVPANIAKSAHIDADQYAAMYKRSVDDPEAFWAEQAENYVSWFKKWDKVLDWSFDKDNLHIDWFKGAKLNVSYNCLDRHLDSRGDQVAIIWEADDPNEERKITYRELHEEVSKFGNVLKSRGSVRSTPSCSAVSRRMPCATASRIPTARWSSPLTSRCAEARRCR